MQLDFAVLTRSAVRDEDDAIDMTRAGLNTLWFSGFPCRLDMSLAFRVFYERVDFGYEHEIIIKVLDENGEPVSKKGTVYTMRPELAQRSQITASTEVHHFGGDPTRRLLPVSIEKAGNYMVEIEIDGLSAKRIPFCCQIDPRPRRTPEKADSSTYGAVRN